MYICNALLHHGHSSFSLTILEYIDISNLSLEKARKLILEREQNYLNFIFSEDEPNTYNLLKEAGSLLGYKHTEESIAKFSGENHPMYGRTGENHPNYGKTHTSETKAKISEAMSGKNHPMFGRTGQNSPMFGRTGENHPASKKIFVYSFDSDTKETILYKSFLSCSEVALYFNCSARTISSYLNKNKLYKKQWILTSSEKST